MHLTEGPRGLWAMYVADPFDGAAYGTDNFSWTAALILDVALEEES